MNYLTQIDSLHPLTAGRLLSIWQDSRQIQDPLERSLLCNARVLAESCFSQGKPTFPNPTAVLKSLTAQQMEQLLCHLISGFHPDYPPASTPAPQTLNPNFDLVRFQMLREA